MDFFAEFLDKLGVEAEGCALGDLFVKHMLPAFGLEERHVVFTLDVTDGGGDFHALAKQFKELGVNHVEFIAEPADVAGCCGPLLAYLETVKQGVEFLWRDLLAAVGESVDRVGVAFDHEAIEVEVEGHLREASHHLAAAADVAGVAQQWQFWHASFQLDGYFPEGIVAVGGMIIGGEAAMDGGDVVDSRLLESFDGSYPEIYVGRDGVFDHDGETAATEALGQFADEEGVDAGARTNPDGIDAIALTKLRMFGTCHLAAE